MFKTQEKKDDGKSAVERKREISADLLHFDLHKEDADVRARIKQVGDEHSAKTLVKNGLLRHTVVSLKKGATLPPHDVEGPLSIQCLRGKLRVSASGSNVDMQEGHLTVLDTRVPYTVMATDDCSLLLTVAMEPDEGYERFGKDTK